MNTFGWIVVIALGLIAIVISAWRLNCLRELCRRIESKLAGATGRLEYWNMGSTTKTYPVIFVKCDPAVREMIRKLGFIKCRCSVVANSLQRIVSDFGIVLATPDDAEKFVGAIGTGIWVGKDFVYLLESPDGMMLVFPDPELPMGVAKTLILFRGEIILAQIALEHPHG